MEKVEEMNRTSKKKMFLIAPVRGLSPDAHKDIVERWEKRCEVYWPARDTNQEDKTGLRICGDNRLAITEADFVCLIWDGKSQGCLFDLGIAFALKKPLYVLEVPETPKGTKSFSNMTKAWARDTRQTAIAELLVKGYN